MIYDCMKDSLSTAAEQAHMHPIQCPKYSQYGPTLLWHHLQATQTTTYKHKAVRIKFSSIKPQQHNLIAVCAHVHKLHNTIRASCYSNTMSNMDLVFNLMHCYKAITAPQKWTH